MKRLMKHSEYVRVDGKHQIYVPITTRERQGEKEVR